MSRIDEKYIQQARAVPIDQVWARLGLPPATPSATFRSPFRQDDHPSCQLGGEKNIFFDHGLGETLDTLQLVRKVRSCEFPEAVAFVLDRSLNDIQQTSEKHSKSAATPVVDSVEELARVRGWSPYALRALGARPKPTCSPREVIIPMRDALGNQVGIRLRRADGLKYHDGGKVKCEPGSKHGLIYPLVWPDEKEAVVLIVEGEADAAAALTADWKAVVATPGAQPSKVCLHQLQLLVSGRKVVMFPDPDEAGRLWLERTGEALLNARCQVAYVPALGQDDLDKRLRQEQEPAAALVQWVCHSPAVGVAAHAQGEEPDRPSGRGATRGWVRQCRRRCGDEFVRRRHGDTFSRPGALSAPGDHDQQPPVAPHHRRRLARRASFQCFPCGRAQAWCQPSGRSARFSALGFAGASEARLLGGRSRDSGDDREDGLFAHHAGGRLETGLA